METIEKKRPPLDDEIRDIAKMVTEETDELMSVFQKEANEYAKSRTLEANRILRILVK